MLFPSKTNRASSGKFRIPSPAPKLSTSRKSVRNFSGKPSAACGLPSGKLSNCSSPKIAPCEKPPEPPASRSAPPNRACFMPRPRYANPCDPGPSVARLCFALLPASSRAPRLIAKPATSNCPNYFFEPMNHESRSLSTATYTQNQAPGRNSVITVWNVGSVITRTIIFCSALFLLAGSSVSAQTAAPAPVKNIILVHGAWADGSSWSKVIPILEAHGLHVVAAKRAIALADGPVILVGHSYGGVVITEAGNDPKVVGLVFVSAFAPDAGENGLGLTKPYPPAPLGSELRSDAQGFLKVTSEGIANDFAQDLSPAEKKLLFATQGPTNIAALQGNVTTAAWKTRPTWFVIAANDRAIPPELEKAEAARMKSTTITVSSSHVAMLAKPAEVSALIVKAAANPGSK